MKDQNSKTPELTRRGFLAAGAGAAAGASVLTILPRHVIGATKKSKGQDVYLGVANCQRCHIDAFDSYLATRHARAYATLSEGFMHRDSGCVPCHSTGYGLKGGFDGVRIPGGMVDLIDVQCEACHGPGASHSRDGSYRTVARERCINCHTEEQDPEFDFEKAWKKIAH